MAMTGSVGDRHDDIRQGQIAVTIAGNSRLWQDWTKKQVREYLHSHIRRSVADLKSVHGLPGTWKAVTKTRMYPSFRPPMTYYSCSQAEKSPTRLR